MNRTIRANFGVFVSPLSLSFALVLLVDFALHFDFSIKYGFVIFIFYFFLKEYGFVIVVTIA